MKIEQLPTADLIPYAKNTRTHSEIQIQQIAGSIREFGFTNPVLIDSENGIIAGHGRVMAAQKLGLAKVPCIRLAHLTDTQKRAYIIADNKLALNAGWDEEMLALELGELKDEDFDLSLIGFDETELGDLMAETTEGETDPDDVPEPPVDPVTVLGDVWILGKHRIVCGDGTSANWIGCDKAGCVIFDPPWDAECATSPPCIQYDSLIAFTDCQRIADTVRLFGAPTWVFVWDCVSSWFTPNRPLKRGKLAAWFGDIKSYNSDGSHYGDAGENRKITNSRGSYDFKPDPRGKHLSDVFSAPITKLHSDGDGSEHKHSKPIDWFRMLIANCSDGIIVDPFAGSGTSIIAGEQLKRPVIACELDPSNVDIIVTRWQAFTGKQAINEQTGKPFNQRD
jgi:hypothetical protein